MIPRNINQNKLYKSCEQFVLSAYKNFDAQPAKLKTFINLFNKYVKPNGQVLECQMQLVELIQDSPDLIEQMNKLVPDDFKVPRLGPYDQGMKEEINEKVISSAIKELQSRRPDKNEDLIKLIEESKDNPNMGSPDGLLEKLRLLLQEDEPALYDIFRRYFNMLFDSNNINRDDGFESANEASNSMSVRMDIEDKDERKPKSVSQIKPFDPNQKVNKPSFVNIRPNLPPSTTSVDKIDATTLPPPIRNELYLFQYLRNNLNDESYDELMRIIHLYSECVISSTEVFMFTKHLFYENENYFSFFCDIIIAREITRRKNTTILKPINELEFKKLGCERNLSYSKMPPNFTHLKSPIHPLNRAANKYLNKTWISVPQGSEVNFKIKAKNAYEETLLKCEDERYEFDTVIYNCATAVKWLNELEGLESEEKIVHMTERILRLKVIQKVYGNNTEIVEIFRRTPLSVAKILADRIQTKVVDILFRSAESFKLKDIKETKFNQARKKWHETSQENFHRSLDHRSFYFKQYEKKLTYHKSFNTDALSRYNEINIQGKKESLRKCCSILNTFDGISNGVACHYNDTYTEVLYDSIKQTSIPRRNLPIFRFVFSDKRISQDIFDMLCLKVQNFHANLTEKDKINKCVKGFMLELLKFPYELGKTFDVVLDSKVLLDIVTGIEGKVYDKNFNVTVSSAKDVDKTASDEIAKAALTRLKEQNKSYERRRGLNGEEMKQNSANAQNHSSSSRRMNEELSPQKHPTESADDELRLDSESEDQTNIKEMEYAVENNHGVNSEFVPQGKKGQMTFYGTQHIYHLLRFYFSLYERFLKALEISEEFEPNSKTALLTEDEKSELAYERYELFKWILVHLIREDITIEKYEDLLRSVFGNKAYLMFFIDKIIHSMIVTIQKMMGDELSMKSLGLYPENDVFGKGFDSNPKNSSGKPKNWLENVYMAQLNHLSLKNINNLQNTTLYRFLYDPKSSSVIINLYNSPYKDWNDKVLDSTVAYNKDYINKNPVGLSSINPDNPIFLKRARERNRKRTVTTLIKIVQSNEIEWKYMPNTLRLTTESFSQQDFLMILKRRGTEAQETRKKFFLQMKRMKRFREWHKDVLEAIK